MVNAQNLKYPIKSIVPPDFGALPGPFDTPDYLDLPMGLGQLPPQMPKGTPKDNSAIQQILDSLQQEESGLKGSVSGRISSAEEIRNKVMSSTAPEQLKRKRVPKDTQLLTGGIGLLLRALGASHEATLGGVNTALAGMQQSLDEEVEAENTKRYNQYKEQMDRLQFDYQHQFKLAGVENDELKEIRGQIEGLQKSLDDSFNKRTALGQDLLKQVTSLDSKGELSEATLNAIVQASAGAGIKELFPQEMYYEFLDRARSNDKMRGLKMSDEEKKIVDDARKRSLDIANLERDAEFDSIKLEVERLERNKKKATYPDEVSKAKADREIAEARAKMAKLEAENKPTELAQQNSLRAAQKANYYSLIEDRANKSAGGMTDLSKEDAKIAGEIAKHLDTFEKSFRSEELAKSRGQSGEQAAQRHVRDYAQEDAVEKYNAAPESVKAKLYPRLVKLGIKVKGPKEMVSRPG